MVAVVSRLSFEAHDLIEAFNAAEEVSTDLLATFAIQIK